VHNSRPIMREAGPGKEHRDYRGGYAPPF